MIPYALIIILMNFTLASVAASGTSNNSLSTNSSSYARNQNINRFATSLNNNITSIFTTPQNLASALRDKRESAFELDPTEIARQNQITQQILTHYIERRLFPFSNVKQKVPSIAEILPKAITSTTSPRAISIATSPTYKRGLASSNNTRRKTYGQKLKNSTRRKYNANKIETHDKEEQEIEQRPSQQRLTENINEDEDATELPATITYSNKYKNQDNHTFYYNNEWSGGRGFLLPYDIEDDVEHDVQEALQSVESEQYDQYYNNDIFQRDPKENEIDGGGDCPNCVDEVHYMNKWTMPLLKLGEKRYYLGIFFKANWFKATQYCRYHGMHLASISSQEENDRLEKYIRDYGLGHEHFWISGTDLADEGNFFWMSTGRPITFTNWNAGEPNNFRYENGEEENCLELWNRDGKGLKWNDSPCSFETYFVCEVQPN